MKMWSFMYELKRTLATMTWLPRMVVNPDHPSTSPTVQKTFGGESLRWVIIQIVILYAFYRLFTPLLASVKGRTYWTARTMMDFWLFSALAIHTPALSATFDPRPTRIFAAVFAVFLVASHLALAAFTLAWHAAGWITRTFQPSLVDTLLLPSGRTWKSPSMGNLIRFSLILSLITSLMFVGCTIQAQETDNIDNLPLVCRQGWYSKTEESEDETTIYKRLGYLEYLGHLSLIRSPVGLLWLSGLALFIIYYTTRRSSRLSFRARLKAAMRLEDVLSRAEALFQTEVEDGYSTDPSSARPPRASKEKPEFLEMCEWYTVAMVDTAVKLLISLKLFFGRFDQRLLKRPKLGMYVRTVSDSKPPVAAFSNEDGSVSPAIRKEIEDVSDTDFYFDWQADTGDGGSSTYQVARWLAKPVLYVRKDPTCLSLLRSEPSLLNSKDFGDLALPRGRLLLIGGDLAYPDPSIENLDKRLFRPFCDAMEPPPSYRNENVSVVKDKDSQVIQTSNLSPPVCYCLAGNHDHFDGLQAFYRCIIDRDWLGGWRLPQTSSYFCIKLVKGWWLFALDQALGEDIDTTQFRYFQHMANHVVGPDDRIILASHEPIWLYDAYSEKDSNTMGKADSSRHDVRAPVFKELFRNHLGNKVALRISGDLHNYMRYEEMCATKQDPGQRMNLVVSGGGGAFLHPTHCFPEFLDVDDKSFRRKSCYPNVEVSRRLAWDNLGSGFREQNWRFDFVGASFYFFLCMSLFPRCGVRARVVDASTEGLSSYLKNYVLELGRMVYDSFAYGYISPFTIVLAIVITLLFAESDKGISLRIRLGLTHGIAHVIVALTAFMLFQITVETAIVDGLAGYSFYSLFETYLETEHGAVPEYAWTDATFLSGIREILRAFDVPEAVAVPHAFLCRDVITSPHWNLTDPSPSSPTMPTSMEITELSRFEVIWFYFASYAYLYVLSADLVALVIGTYLAVSSYFHKVHWNESFSSLRHRHMKNFIRFKIDHVTGDLHAFVLGVDRVPNDWMLNSNYETTAERMKRLKIDNELDPRVASFGASTPSKWLPTKRKDALQSKPRLVDYFVVRKNPMASTPT